MVYYSAGRRDRGLNTFPCSILEGTVGSRELSIPRTCEASERLLIDQFCKNGAITVKTLSYINILCNIKSQK